MIKVIKNKKMFDRKRAHARIRSKISGTADRPRLAFFKSNKNLYAQLIDDTASKTLVGVSSLKSSKKKSSEKAVELGEMLAKEASSKGIKEVVFDRGGFRYMGVVKIFADTARSGGLKF